MTSPAPPVLGEPLPIELANTRFVRRAHELDGLQEPQELAAWLRQVRERLPFPLADETLDAIGPAELDAARALRDALRSLLAAATSGATLDADAARTLNRTVRAAPRWRELTTRPRPAATLHTAAAPLPATLAAIAEEAIHLLEGPDAATLRACAAPDCILFFRKDNPRRNCCSPRCSNRTRAARHYARHKTQA